MLGIQQRHYIKCPISISIWNCHTGWNVLIIADVIIAFVADGTATGINCFIYLFHFKF